MTEVYEKALKLIDAIKESGSEYAQEDAQSVEEWLKTGAQYYNTVITGSFSSKLAYIRFDDEPEKLKDCIENLDKDRRLAHQALTRSVNFLNNMAKMYSVEPIFDIDRELDDDSKDDRDFAAVLVYRFTTEAYLDEMTRSNYLIKEDTFREVDDALYKMEKDAKRFDESRRIEPKIKEKGTQNKEEKEEMKYGRSASGSRDSDMER